MTPASRPREARSFGGEQRERVAHRERFGGRPARRPSIVARVTAAAIRGERPAGVTGASARADQVNLASLRLRAR